PKRTGIGRPPPGGAGLSLEIAQPAGPRARKRGARQRGRGRRLFRHPGEAGAIGAWASKQSAPLESRLAFEKAVALYAAKYALITVPRPPNWSGYRIMPLRIEFWHERPFRLHDRIEFARGTLSAPWSKTRLYP